MKNYNHIIYQYLKNIEQYKNINMKDIIDGSQFNSKQFESICLDLYRTFMSAYLPDDRIQIRLLDHNTINGMAILIDNTYYSLIHWGTITNLYEYSLYLTENPSFFPGIYTNKNWKKIEQSDISESGKQQESYYHKLYLCGPNDSYRRDLAFLISFFAWYSTVFHEAGHILDGHLQYINHYLHKSSLDMVQNNSDESLYIKTLEKDADEFSANRIIEYAFLPGNVFQREYSNIIKTEKTLIQIIVTGITLKFLLFGINDNVNSELYLPSAYRIINIIDAAYYNLKNEIHCSLTKKEYDKIAISSIKSLISVYNSTLSPSINIETFVSQLYIGHAENEKLKPIWNELYPILDKYKNDKINLAPIFQ